MQTELHYRLVEGRTTTFGYLAHYGDRQVFRMPKIGAVLQPEHPDLSGSYVIQAIDGPFTRDTLRTFMLDLEKIEHETESLVRSDSV